MHMRLLTLRLKLQVSDRIRDFYSRRVLPALQDFEGCLYATLTESVADPTECISLTFWDTQEHMEAYEKSETSKTLLRESKVFLSDAGGVRVQLSEDLTLEYVEVKEDPKVTSFDLYAAMDKAELRESTKAASYLRLLRFKVKPDRLEDAKQGYADNVLPILSEVEGCRYACLMGSLGTDDELVSMTIWDNKESADRYERSAVFQDILKKATEVAPALQWKMALESPLTDRVYSSGDLTVGSYAVVTGKSFDGGPSGPPAA